MFTSQLSSWFMQKKTSQEIFFSARREKNLGWCERSHRTRILFYIKQPISTAHSRFFLSTHSIFFKQHNVKISSIKAFGSDRKKRKKLYIHKNHISVHHELNGDDNWRRERDEIVCERNGSERWDKETVKEVQQEASKQMMNRWNKIETLIEFLFMRFCVCDGSRAAQPIRQFSDIRERKGRRRAAFDN